MTNRLKEGSGLFVYSAAALAAGIVSLFPDFHCFAWIAILASDLYLMFLLYVAAARVDYENIHERTDYTSVYPCSEYLFPNLRFGLFIFLLFFMAIVFGFASLYVGTNVFCEPKTWFDAFYTSLFIMGFDNPAQISEYGKGIVIAQFFSSILLLVGVFPLLISRIAGYKSNH